MRGHSRLLLPYAFGAWDCDDDDGDVRRIVLPGPGYAVLRGSWQEWWDFLSITKVRWVLVTDVTLRFEDGVSMVSKVV